MAKIKFETGQVVNFEGTPTPEDIEEIAAQFKQEQPPEQAQNSLGFRSKFNKPLIGTPEFLTKPLVSSPEQFADVGQFAGGFGGAALGFAAGGPPGAFVGAPIGATLGRGIGKTAEVVARPEREKPFSQKLLSAATTPLIKGRLLKFGSFSPEDVQEIQKETQTAATIEAIAAPIGAGLGRLASFFGKGVAKNLLGPRIAERGIERGWKALLDPKFYKNRVPKEIVTKTNNFFNRLTGVSGKNVGRAISQNDKTLDITPIKEAVRQLLPESGDPLDLLEITAPKSQKDLITKITGMVLGQRGNTRKVSTLWELRKTIDPAIFNKSWTADGRKYLMGVRQALNTPIKGASPQIGKAFSQYSFVKEVEEDLGQKFLSVRAPDDQFAPQIESFAQTLLSSSKDETIAMLRNLDEVLDVEDRVIEQLLDLSAAETFERGVGLTPFQKMLLGMFGGRKLIPRIGAGVQAPVTQAAKTGFGRFVPTAATGIAAEDNR